jgi:hypothetical protein
LSIFAKLAGVGLWVTCSYRTAVIIGGICHFCQACRGGAVGYMKAVIISEICQFSPGSQGSGHRLQQLPPSCNYFRNLSIFTREPLSQTPSIDIAK